LYIYLIQTPKYIFVVYFNIIIYTDTKPKFVSTKK